MDQEEPRADNVVPEAEFFWRKFKYYLRQMVYGEITQQDFVDNMMKLGYSSERIKEILDREEKDEDD
tara:strand:- start:134 stop:334 length:201 start_codon:yes stop_codon:yes gene_type:complete